MRPSSEAAEQLYRARSLQPGGEESFHVGRLHSKASCHLCLAGASDRY